MTIGVLLLAAGGSRRLGQPKQLLPCPGSGEPLVAQMARVAIASDLGPVVVVLGAAEPECRAALAGLPVRLIHHPAWEAGMGGSLAAGMAGFAGASVTAVLVLLVDQYQVDAEALRHLADRHRNSAGAITASRWAETLGPPAIFPARLFPALAALSGPAGARTLLHGSEPVVAVDLPGGPGDLDTPEDVAAWQADMPQDRGGRPIR